MSGPSFPWFKMILVVSGFTSLGYLTMKATTPTPEQLYNEMSPDLRKKVDIIREARLAAEAASRQQAKAQLNDPDAQKPIWADRPS
ncbi:uncharacterized protein LAESUDRAFT_814594 [Laetiporus sulphureus 93-53]|uniref:Assembly factor cbp4 n=1 Tax=Laetiporus sulphureus 93-53 TaxID=1314785 RepID=A0A165CV66_9APHY|nr:uncharacterized protein LAESUDRAFT_814594 [Laetiporus sulphureus 93-53]KZT03486.1 hypothetical protein LAESUDRAFT_814594 [Laetiporus sulphureus 93-53]